MTKNKIFLIDAMALIYRAYFAFMRNPRINSQGMNTSAVLGFTNSLVEVLHKQRPTHVIVAFDTPSPTFRKKIYPLYKAHRQEQPEDITTAIPYIKDLLQALNIPILEKEGYEADDIIGTLASSPELQPFDVYIMTPDKDFAQLVDNNTYLYRPGLAYSATTIWGEGEVLQDWDIASPKQVIDILGLWGDASDNIPGVPNIGKKTAQKLIKQFHTIENLLKNTHELKGQLQANLINYSEQALLSKKLATICTTVPIAFNLNASKYVGPDAEKIMKICNDLGFRQLSQRILNLHKASSPIQTSLFPSSGSPDQTLPSTPSAPLLASLANTPHEYYCIDTLEKFDSLVEKLQHESLVAFDTETTGLDSLEARLIGLSIAYKPHEAYYIPLTSAHAQKFLDRLKPILTDVTKQKIGQNLKYDLHILRRHGIEVAPPFFDTMVAHHLLQPEARHNLDEMAVNHLSYKPMSIELLIGKRGKGLTQKCMSEVPLDKLTDYACEDADVTLRLYHKFKLELEENNLMKLFNEIEMPLLPVLVAMEREGVAIDQVALAEASTTLQKEMDVLIEAMYTLAHEEFNVNSPKQLGHILFDKLKLVEKPGKTKTGQYDTSQATLSKITAKHPIIDKVITYRELKKLQSTYVDALPGLVSSHDHRIHTSYHQTHVYTGRLSSSHPNLQNIPIRTEKGRFIRKAFVTSHPDHYLVAADYSQIELRFMAHFAQDQAMIEAFKAGEDIHTATATKIFGREAKDLDPGMRRQAKMVNFGIIYGMSAFGLAQRLEIPRKKASDIINAYFEQFPAVKTYMERTVAQVRDRGFVTTLWGRKRFFPNINSRNATIRSMDERAAINMPIQGSAAELIKQAMMAIHAWQHKEKIPAKMIMQVHDELVFEVHSSVLDHFKKHIALLMQSNMKLLVPIVVDVGIGKSWFEAHYSN